MTEENINRTISNLIDAVDAFRNNNINNNVNIINNESPPPSGVQNMAPTRTPQQQTSSSSTSYLARSFPTIRTSNRKQSLGKKRSSAGDSKISTENRSKQAKGKTYLKDVILIPSPKLSTVPKSKYREELFDAGFVLTGFELDTLDAESVLKEKLYNLFKDIFSLNDKTINFEFVRCIEGRLMKVKTGGPMDGKRLYFIAGSRQLPIYIRAKTDFRYLLKSRDMYCPSEVSDFSDDDLEPAFHSSVDHDYSKLRPSMQTTFEKCPICNESFTSNLINLHASSCGIDDDNDIIEESNSGSQSYLRPEFSTVLRSSSSTISKPPFVTPSRLPSSTLSRPPTSTISRHPTSTVSRPPASIVSKPPLSFKEEMKNLKTKFMASSEEPVRFQIRMNNVYEDVVKKMKVFFKNSKPLKPVVVSFLEERGVDDGGPSREMFCKVFGNAANYVLNGMENNYTLQHDIHSFERGDFFVYGQLIALSLLHGYPGPHNLAKPLAQHLIGAKTEFEICDVPEYEVQEKLKELKNCTTKESLHRCMEQFDERFEAGYTKTYIGLDEVDELVFKLSKYFVLEKQHKEIDQLAKGMQCFGLLETMRAFPKEALKELIYIPNHLKAMDISSIYEIKFSDSTSPWRKLENDVAFQWLQFLEELEVGQSESIPLESIDGTASKAKVTLEDVLQFLTGSRFLPSIGFGRKGKVQFVEVENKASGIRATVSTCFLWLKIPLSKRYTGDNFAKNFASDMFESPGFGRL